MIKIFTTGGTIGGLEYADKQDKPSNDAVDISKLLDVVDIPRQYSIESLFHKDSRHITAKDREYIVKNIKLSEEQHILITHGTLTMVETAKYLGRLSFSKTIILTGAFILGTHPDSDATENLKFALSLFKLLPKGVYIAMHETIFPWENVKKNTMTNQFEKSN